MSLIPERETLTVEFKSDRKKLSDSELLDEVVGFANTNGGTIYVGVEDNGNVTGVCKEHQDSIGVAALEERKNTRVNSYCKSRISNSIWNKCYSK